LTKDLEDNGITGNFHYDKETPTGTCAVLVYDKNRTLCANLAAACKYDLEHLKSNMDALKNAQIIYSTSFFITSNVQALMEVAQYATDNKIPFGFNMSAVFLLQFELKNVLAAMEHADYVFANEDEAKEFGKIRGMEQENFDYAGVAKIIAKEKKTKQDVPRYCIVTHGEHPVIVAKYTPGDADAEVKEYPVDVLTKDQLVDTNGAGDAFVGGFMAMLKQGKDIDTCVKAGIYLSREVVQRSGCTFPDKFDFTA